MVDTTFSIRLRNYLKQRNMKAAQLARLTGLSEPLLSQYLNDKIKPKYDNILCIAKVLNIDPLELMGLPTTNSKITIGIDEATTIVIKEYYGDKDYQQLNEHQKEELMKAIKHSILLKKMEFENT